MVRASYDLIVIGAGNAGLAAARIARESGWSVLAVEAREVGGTCPLRGCVPKKVLVAAGETLDQIARARVHEIRVGKARLDWAKLIARKETFVEGVPAAFEKSLRKQGIDVARGRARFVDPHAVSVGRRRFEAKKILVATGSKPRPLELPGGGHAITSDEILEMKRLPRSITFVGAGVISFEFAHVLARAGSRVTILEIMPRPLPSLDREVVDLLAGETRALGIRLETGVRVEAIERRGARSFVVRHAKGRAKRRVSAELVANGAGRIADLEGLDLAAGGVDVEEGKPVLDEHLRSRSNPDVLFAGDAHPGAPQLSPVATYEGKIAGRNLLGGALESPDYSSIPSVVYTVPALATVGLMEEEATRQGRSFDVKRNDLADWRASRTYGERTAFSKVLVEKRSGKILGATLLGHGAAELIHAFALAMRHGLKAADLEETIYAYPTLFADVKFLV